MIIFPNREKIATKNQYPEAILTTLDAFYKVATTAQWKTPLEVKQTFPEATVLKSGRIILDIENQYHLVIKINLRLGAIRVEFFEPHGKLPEILGNISYLKKFDTP